jgi:ribonuclease P/MRP protein subunit RPP1
MADPGANFRLAALAGAYDMLALRPTTEKAFNFACLNATEASLISLDLTTSFPFYFKPKPCMAAVRRGTRFEVCYGQVLDPGADSRRRAAFVGNLMGLVRATKGRGLVVSSEARSVLGLRGPADVVNLLAVWGLSTDKGTEAIGVNPRGVVVNEGLKRRSFRGVIDVVKPADKAESASAEGPGTADASKGIAAKQQAPRASTASGEKNLKAAAGDKRKREAGASGDSDDPPKISKRQAKKLKAAGKTAGGSHQEPK